MKIKTVFWAAAMPIAMMLAAAVPAFGQPNRSELKTGKLNSVVLSAQKEYSVYLPAGYWNSDKKYPVLYLLHGAWENHLSWVNRGDAKLIADRLMAQGESVPMIIVMPDARGQGSDMGGKNMGYFNQAGWSYEEFFFKELIPHIEANFRVRADKAGRAVAGCAMGGGGAMVYALHQPEVFSSCCPMSGLLGDYPENGAVTSDSGFRNSVIDNDPVEIIKHAGEGMVKRLSAVRWYLDCGDQDYLCRNSINTYLAMLDKNIPIQFRMRGGSHDWEYWQSSLPGVLRFVSVGFAQ